jgi:hypothetical protein
LSTYGKPLIAIPLAAVSKVQRTSFDTKEDFSILVDQTPDKLDPKTTALHNNLIEIMLKDDFLPIYTH